MTDVDVAAERDFWDEHAGDRLAVWGEPDYAGSVRPSLGALLPPLGLGEWANVLDLGCGPGRLTFPVARAHRAWSVYGVDVSPAMLAEAENLAGMHDTNAVFMVCDGRSLPPGLPPIDAAFSMLLFQHIPDQAVCGYLAEIGRVLRPGGRFRFQFVAGVENAFLHRHRPVDDVTGWCETAGLSVDTVDVGVMMEPQWCFMTATKGQR